MLNYQKNAARTINPDLTKNQQITHALHGMASEVGEIHGIYQKMYQGHGLDESHVRKELGDLLWFIAELCTAYDWDLDVVCWENIEKLRNRYPKGFTEQESLHRAEGDI